MTSMGSGIYFASWASTFWLMGLWNCDPWDLFKMTLGPHIVTCHGVSGVQISFKWVQGSKIWLHSWACMQQLGMDSMHTDASRYLLSACRVETPWLVFRLLYDLLLCTTHCGTSTFHEASRCWWLFSYTLHWSTAVHAITCLTVAVWIILYMILQNNAHGIPWTILVGSHEQYLWDPICTMLGSHKHCAGIPQALFMGSQTTVHGIPDTILMGSQTQYSWDPRHNVHGIPDTMLMGSHIKLP